MKSIDLSDYIQLEGPLFEEVQRSVIFSDSKTFVDAIPKNDPQKILHLYQKLKKDPDFDLNHFISLHFHLPDEVTETDITTEKTMESHIHKLWNYLRREPDKDVSKHSSLIPLPYPYIVPGGRFREMYYWDSYFTAEGLAASGHMNMVENLIMNFCYLINEVGHVPNGNRIYYLSRSQPPFLFMLIKLLERHNGRNAINPYLDSLKNEYAFWMHGTQKLSNSHPVHHRVVYVNEESILNRYWDNRPLPREESWLEDVEIGQNKTHPQQTYWGLRAGAESGWDFSSRWLADYSDLSTIRTTEILPADLNALLFGMEHQLGQWCKDKEATRYKKAADQRKKWYNRYFWDENESYYFDYDWVNNQRTDCHSLVGVYPLFVGMASEKQAAGVASTLKKYFLMDGGLVTSLHETGQQWDYPNGWSPLQWMAVVGLQNYGHNGLAEEIGRRWLKLNRNVFDRTGKMMEKYNVCDLSLEAGGGEYPLQDGFGWTNGIAMGLQKLYEK